MVNKVILIGYVGSVHPMCYTPSNTAILRLSLATTHAHVNKQGQKVKNTTWHDVVIIGKLAESVVSFVKKGSLIYIEGRIDHKDYTDRSGAVRYKTEIIAETLRILEKHSDNQSSQSVMKDDVYAI